MKKVITEREILKLHSEGNTVLHLSKGDILTPLAKDKCKDLGLRIVSGNPVEGISPKESEPSFRKGLNIVAIGSDHTGFKFKNILARQLMDKGFEINDVGTYDEKSCDYPDFAYAVAVEVAGRKADFGIIIDATGNPSAITANKIKGIRAANCYNEFSARSAREHNNANVLTMGGKSIGEETAKSILEVWLNTAFGGGRHQRRLSKISEIEDRGMK